MTYSQRKSPALERRAKSSSVTTGYYEYDDISNSSEPQDGWDIAPDGSCYRPMTEGVRRRVVGGDDFQNISPSANRARLAALDAEKERDKRKRKGRGLEQVGMVAARVIRGLANE